MFRKNILPLRMISAGPQKYLRLNPPEAPYRRYGKMFRNKIYGRSVDKSG